jgi:hypothetical protein
LLLLVVAVALLLIAGLSGKVETHRRRITVVLDLQVKVVLVQVVTVVQAVLLVLVVLDSLVMDKLEAVLETLQGHSQTVDVADKVAVHGVAEMLMVDLAAVAAEVVLLVAVAVATQVVLLASGQVNKAAEVAALLIMVQIK